MFPRPPPKVSKRRGGAFKACWRYVRPSFLTQIISSILFPLGVLTILCIYGLSARIPMVRPSYS